MTDEQDNTGAKASELELRRQRVLQLRLRQMTEAAIAAVIGVDQKTVSRDLRWIVKHWRDLYGLRPKFDPAEEVGAALALFADVESLRCSSTRESIKRSGCAVLARCSRLGSGWRVCARRSWRGKRE